jgi:hypothetical protein
MKISELNTSLKNRNKLLFYFGWINLIAFAACLLFYFIDDTLVTGINAWVKPMKFTLSITIYSWTFGWLLHYLKSKAMASVISWFVVITMLVENVIIIIQAARGEISHYNISSALNGMFFGLMGVFIGINTIINALTLLLFLFKSKVTIEGYQLLAWRAGLLLFLVGSISGGLMIANMGHTVGAVDGGPGIPFTNWSTQAGDLRVAHFFTLHGLQLIPLFAYTLAETKSNKALRVLLFSIGYAIICMLMHYVAIKGQPLLGF